MDVGLRLRELRRQKSMSVYKLHQLSNISEAHIRNLEKGSKKASVETLEILVQSLDITMSEFFNESDSVAYLTESENILIQYFRTLPKVTAEAVVDFCEKMQNRGS